MQLVWNMEGVKVFGTVQVRWVNDIEPWITGLGLREATYGGVMSNQHDRIFSWQAKAISNGYFVEITTEAGLRGSFQGSTFNLPLEVATAARRIL